MLKLILLFVLVSTGGTANAAEEFLYRAYHYKSTVENGCASEADALAQKLALETGVEVVGGACAFDSYTDQTTLVVRYRADVELNLVSTYNPARYLVPNSFYKSQDACLASYDRDLAIFKEQTGLEPFVSYCAQRTQHDSLGWYVHIDAFGTAQRIPQFVGWYSSQVYGMTFAEFYQAISQKLSNAGYPLSHLAWRPSVAHNSVSVQVWREPTQEELELRSEVLLTVPGLEVCQALADDIASQLGTRSDVFHLASYCTSPYSGPRHFDLVTVTNVVVTRVNYSAEKYHSKSECDLQLGSMLQQQRVLHGDRVLAGVCGLPRYQASSSHGYRGVFLLK